MMAMTCESSIVSPLFLSRICQAKTDPTRAFLLENKFSTITVTASPRQVVSAARLCNPNLATKVVVPWRRKKGRRQQERKSTTCGKVEILLSLAKRHLLLLGLYVCLPIDILFIQNLRFGVLLDSPHSSALP